MRGNRSNANSVFMKIIARGMRQRPLTVAFVSFSVALTVAVSILASSAVNVGAHNLGKRVLDPEFEFPGLAIFWYEDDYTAFKAKRDFWNETSPILEFPLVRGMSGCGDLLVAGLGEGLPAGTIKLLGGAVWPDDSLRVDFQKGGAFVSRQWAVVQGESDHAAALDFPGWACVNPVALSSLLAEENVDCAYTGVVLYEQKDVEKIRRDYPRTTVMATDSGKKMIERAGKRALMPWQLASFLVLLAASFGVSCVLTAAFLGRKRALGILKVLGATKRDYARLMMLEGLCLGGPGIVFGFPLGVWAARFGFGKVMAGTWGFVAAFVFGLATIILGVYLPLRLVRNATCDQLLHNKPVYAVSNPSCAECGLCGGF